MNISIRDSTLDDLSEIFRIRNNPLVAPHQYRIREDDSMEAWLARLSGHNKTGNMTYRSSTILCEQQIAGHVSHIHYSMNDVPVCLCGWNLDPQYWGLGIMRTAL